MSPDHSEPTRVCLLHQLRGDDEHGDSAKLIGVYRSVEAAHLAIARLRGQPGFRDHPQGFHAELYELDEDHWAKGFGS